MSTSYGTSLNQSTESGTSSLLRSGLNISVGDTKSIVLALQALQQKIRALEQDRDFHQEQYDRALQAHEAYKLDMERQAEKERAEHHRREEELRELLRNAREEKAKLESAVNGSHNDLSTFREELEKLIAEEKEQAERRESKLREEMDRLRQEISEERARYAAMMVSMEKLRAEREAAYDTNDELRAAIEDLERLRQRRSAAAASSHSTGGGGHAGRAGAQRGRSRGRSATTSPAKSSSSAHSHLRDANGRRTYRDPTCNSRLRDVRTTDGEVFCARETPVATGAAGTSALAGGTNTSATDYGGGSSRIGTPSRAANAFAVRTRPAPVANAGPHHHHHRSPTSGRRAAQNNPNDEGTPMAMVEVQLREELADLQREYRNTIDRASSENLPRNVVNTALERISELMDKKEDQLRLMQAARHEVARANNAGSTSSSTLKTGGGGGGGYTSADVMADKATQRAALVNELRSLLAEGGKL